MFATEAVKKEFEEKSNEELVKENALLKQLNEKLYKRTLNQKRKILRLKKMLDQSGCNTNDVKIVDEDTGNVWEDVEEVMASYNMSKN